MRRNIPAVYHVTSPTASVAREWKPASFIRLDPSKLAVLHLPLALHQRPFGVLGQRGIT